MKSRSTGGLIDYVVPLSKALSRLRAMKSLGKALNGIASTFEWLDR